MEPLQMQELPPKVTAPGQGRTGSDPARWASVSLSGKGVLEALPTLTTWGRTVPGSLPCLVLDPGTARLERPAGPPASPGRCLRGLVKYKVALPRTSLHRRQGQHCCLPGRRGDRTSGVAVPEAEVQEEERSGSPETSAPGALVRAACEGARGGRSRKRCPLVWHSPPAARPPWQRPPGAPASSRRTAAEPPALGGSGRERGVLGPMMQSWEISSPRPAGAMEPGVGSDPQSEPPSPRPDAFC